jgi:hypothetical protein
LCACGLVSQEDVQRSDGSAHSSGRAGRDSVASELGWHVCS